MVSGVSCTTAYDYYGNPRPVVEPGVAVLGAAAVGITALALANSGNNNRYCAPQRNYNNCYTPRNRGYYGHGYGNSCYGGW